MADEMESDEMRSSWWRRHRDAPGMDRLLPPAVFLIISIICFMFASTLGLIAFPGHNYHPAIFYAIVAILCLIGVSRAVCMHRR